MYIPTWILVGIVIAVFIYVSRSKKKGADGKYQFAALGQESQEKYSYRLSISLEPNWYQVLKAIYNPKDEKEWEKISKKIEKIEKNQDEDLCGRRYYFTEYYDSASGQMMRFQETILPNGKRRFVVVDEFGDYGYIFRSDWKLETDEEKKKEKEKMTVEIGENYIRNDIFDKVIGGLKIDFDYEKENYLFWFPLDTVFNFKFALGQRFYETEECLVLKWPEKIEKAFEKHGIKYETYFDYGEPNVFNMEEYDKEFYEKMGKPKISSSKPSQFHSAYLSSDMAHYGVSLKIFRPSENFRVSENFSLSNDSAT